METTECHSCGEVASCDSAAYGEPVCESCHHATDWHRGCDPDDAPTVCPFCGCVLAVHEHAGTSALVELALDWLVDCFDDVPYDIGPDEIITAVERHYQGGWSKFIRVSA